MKIGLGLYRHMVTRDYYDFAQPLSAAVFPLPYGDGFEQTFLGHTPKYLSDQDGAFYVQPWARRPGRCLE